MDNGTCADSAALTKTLYVCTYKRVNLPPLLNHSFIPTTMANPTYDGGWFTVTYKLDHDYKGVTTTEHIPVRAFEYLVRTNPSLGLTNGKGKHCNSPFNYLNKAVKFAQH